MTKFSKNTRTDINFAMNREKARQILTQSITNLEKRKGGVTQGDLEAEVINNACLAIIKNQNDKIGKGTNIREILVGALNSSEDYHKIANDFINAANDLLPEYFDKEEAEIVLTGIEQNLAWDGMWEFLVDYFEKNHGIKIEEDEPPPVIFFSDRQQKYEEGELISETEDEKTIYISFSQNKKEVKVKIDHELPTKKGILVSKDGLSYIYKNEKLNYTFTIQYDDYEEVASLTINFEDEDLEVIYLE